MTELFIHSAITTLRTDNITRQKENIVIVERIL